MQDQSPQRWAGSCMEHRESRCGKPAWPSDGRHALLQAAGRMGHPRAFADLQIIMVLHWTHFFSIQYAKLTLRRKLNLFIHLVQEHNQNINLQERWFLGFIYVQGMLIRIPDSELSSGAAGGNAHVCTLSPSQRGPT